MVAKCLNGCHRKILDIDQTDRIVCRILIDCVNCYMDPVIHIVKYSTIAGWLNDGTMETDNQIESTVPSKDGITTETSG